MIKCIICHQQATLEQPMYCGRCFVPIAQNKNGKYIGNILIPCPKCGNALTDGSCSCGYRAWIDDLEKLFSQFSEEETRVEGRDKLAKGIVDDSRMLDQIISYLGLEGLSLAEQGVALSSLANEKMNFLSVEYNFNEAHTLLDLGMALCERAGEKWAIELVKVRLSAYYIRAGMPQVATRYLLEVLDKIDNKFFKLEVNAYLALSLRLLGFNRIASRIVEDVLGEIRIIFREMQGELNEYIKEGHISNFQGFFERGKFPRIDLLAKSLIILVDEAIARDIIVDDVVLDRMLELDNIIEILAKMSPVDDPIYFSSYFREYMRLIGTLYWYGDVLIHTTAVKRRALLDRAYITIGEWLKILKPELLLSLRPVKIIEAFMRAQNWSKRIDGDKLIRGIIASASRESKPQFEYIAAQAKRNLNQLDDAVKYLKSILGNETAGDTLRAMADRMLWEIQLESLGILTGIDINSNITLPIVIQLEEEVNVYEPESYIKEQIRKPILRLSFDTKGDVIREGIAIFGERLLNSNIKWHSQIIKVGDFSFDDKKWFTPHIKAQGIRMDIVIIATQLKGHEIFLLFEANEQNYREVGDEIFLDPPSLLVLRGIISHIHVEPSDVIEELIAIINSKDKETDIYTLKQSIV